MNDTTDMNLHYEGPQGVDHYLAKADQAVGENDMEQARRFLERAFAISGGTRDIKKRLAMHHLRSVVTRVLGRGPV